MMSLRGAQAERERKAVFKATSGLSGVRRSAPSTKTGWSRHEHVARDRHEVRAGGMAYALAFEFDVNRD